MNRKSLNWGVGITVGWLILVFIFAYFKNYNLPDNLNELGDFLAGVFAPVAFFWLILGYIQQSKQLEQNTKALEQQEKALQLQIKEMKESVDQQRKVALLMEQERNDSKRQVKPTIEILDSFAQIIDESNFRITLDIKNNGVGDACNVEIFMQEAFERLTKLQIDSNQRISFEISKTDFDWSFCTYDYDITISYNDILLNPYVSVKKLIIKNNQNQERNFETQILNLD